MGAFWSRFAATGLCLSALAGTGCAPEFERPSELRTLRVLAVQKDKPYARPGETVNLEMLWHDGLYEEGSTEPRRPVQIAWLSGCFDPPADLFYGCFADLPDPQFSTCTTGGAEPCERFSFEMPADVISRRPRPLDPTQPPYGIAFVFFAACAGTLGPAPATSEQRAFPIGCFDAGGQPLGPEDFVAVYSIVFSYDAFANQNPIITGFEFNGEPVPADQMCIGGECQDKVFPDVACGAGPCIETCEEDGDPVDCDGTKFRPIVDRSSAELDEISVVTRGRTLGEQMWINYYVDRGGVKSDARLLNDAVAGWNDDYGTELFGPKDAGRLRIWAVVHDNRGGMSWASIAARAE
jgi:hypothetical protein